MKHTFEQKRVIEDIENWANSVFKREDKSIEKPFYHWQEWQGWRFYLKAWRYKDWKSIKGHIKSTYFWWITSIHKQT